MRSLGKMVVLLVFTIVVAPLLLVYLLHRDATPTSRARIASIYRLIAYDY